MHEAEVGLTSLGLTPQESPDFSPGRRSKVSMYNPLLLRVFWYKCRNDAVYYK